MFAKAAQLPLPLSSKTSAASCKHTTDFGAPCAENATLTLVSCCPLGMQPLDDMSKLDVQQLEGSREALCLV